MNKLVLLVGFIFLLTLFVAYYLMDDSQEYFTNPNLIENGSFNDGEKITNTEKMNANNKIIIYPNPGNSSYVIKQSAKLTSNNVSEVIYQINMKVKANKQYLLSCWVNHTNNWDGKDDLFYLKLWKLKGNPDIKIHKGNVIATKNINKKTWELRNYLIKIPNNTSEYIDWYLGYNPGNNNGFRYITNVSFEPYFPLLKHFSTTNGLQCLLSSVSSNSYDNSNYSKIWKDLSSNGQDFKWNTTPKWNKFSGFDTSNNKLIGDSLNTMSMDNTHLEFSFILFGQNKPKTKGDVFKLETPNIANSITITIDTYQNEIIIYQNDKIKSQLDLGISTMDIVYTFSYKNGIMKLYINNVEITKGKEIQLDKVILSDKPFIINPNSNWNANIYNLLIYNRQLTTKEIDSIYKYLIYQLSSISGNFTTKPLTHMEVKKPDMNRLQMNYETPNVEEEEEEENREKPLSEMEIGEILEEENRTWNKQGMGWPKNQAKRKMGKGFSLADCKQACLNATTPYQCKAISISEDGEGVCDLYTNTSKQLEGVDYKDAKGKEMVTYNRLDLSQIEEETSNTPEETIESFVPSFHTPSKTNFKEWFLGTQTFSKTTKEKNKKIEQLKINITQQLNSLEIIEKKHHLIFKEKTNKLMISLKSSNTNKRKSIVKQIKDVQNLHQKHSTDISKKRQDLMTKLIHLENIVMDRKTTSNTLPSTNNNKPNTNIGSKPLIDAQGQTIHNATYQADLSNNRTEDKKSCELYQYDENGNNTGKCEKYRTNELDTGIFNRVLYQPPDKDGWQQCPNMNQYIRKDKIPCWGCNLDDDNCYQKCKDKENSYDTTDKNNIYRFL